MTDRIWELYRVQTTSKLLIIDFSVTLTPTNSDTNLPYFIPKYGLISVYLNVSTEIECRGLTPAGS